MKSILIIAMIFAVVNADLVFLNADTTTEKCPKYACDSANGDSCAQGKGKMAETRTITFNPCTTPDKKVCVFNVNQFYTDTDQKSPCTDIPAPADVKDRLPGEDCKTVENCEEITYYVKDTKSDKKRDCVSNKCVGSAKDSKCDDHTSCVVGHYCKGAAAGTPGTCTPLIEATKDCTSSFECKNNLFCNDKKCTEAISLDNGVEVKLPQEEEDFALGLCKSGLVVDKKCATTKYDADAKLIVDGVVKCNYKEKCKYNYFFKDDGSDKKAAPEQECVCTMSADGQGYCPYSRGDVKAIDRNNQINGYAKELLNNTFHTLHRFEEAAGSEAKGATCLAVYRDVGRRNAVSCLKDNVALYKACTLISSGFITFSISAILMFFVALF
jgi:hypothetical protein